ncbi:porin [Burkholderia sp. BCC1977]|uniref:porin n=1 Tax=Burkholderia sp. BCC1977 TaxID=2817440 RepID=UPI0039F222F4
MTIGTSLAICFSCVAHAQSSVTLYGTLDEGINFTSNAGGHRAYAMVSGDTFSSGFGLTGTEDLGGGMKAIFKLENGMNLNNGSNYYGRMFNQQAYVGLSSASFGTLTFGRQYEATLDMWSLYTAAGTTIGDFAAHPFNNDNADYSYRFNNSVKYRSPLFHGLEVEGIYGFSNSENFAANRAYSAAANYTLGSFSAVLAYMKQNNGGTTATGAVSTDNVFVGSSQQNIDAGIKWSFTNGSSVAFAYSHTVVYDPTSNLYVSNIGSQSWKSWKFDNFELNGKYFIAPDLFVTGAYTYTHGKLATGGAEFGQNWHQVSGGINYLLSKRTSVFVQSAWQHTNGKSGTGMDFAFIPGSAGASSNGNQFVARLGMLHRF